MARAAALSLIGLGGWVGVAWLLGRDGPKGIAPGLATMKFNTAASFVLIGIALGLRQVPWRKAQRVGQALAGLTLGIGLVTLAEYALHQNLGLDELVVGDPASIVAPGRMAPGTALGFVLSAIAYLLVMRVRRWRIRPTELLAIIVGTTGLVALLGYLYDVWTLYQVPLFSTMAVHTAAGFMVCALGLLAADESHWFVGFMTNTSPGVSLARRLLPPVVLLPTVLGYVALTAEHRGVLPSSFGLTLIVSGTVLMLAVVVTWTATRVHQSFEERKHAEAAQRRAEVRLARAERTEMVSRFAGGIAHDFNNILTVIVGQADLLLMDWPTDSPDREDLEQIYLAGQRAQALIRELMLLSHQDPDAASTIDVREVLNNMDGLLSRLVHKSTDFAMILPEPLGRVRMSQSSLERVVTNLVVNARDAMPSGGQLTVEATDCRFAQRQDDLHLDPGTYVQLTVSDTGHGMDAETRAKIFDPFFTTKPRGKGTGLGLATVHGLVTQGGGAIAVQGEPGRGTAFTIYLRVVGDDKAEAKLKLLSSTEPRRGHGETVLVIQYEAPVRSKTCRILQELGYRVVEAPKGPEALQYGLRLNAPLDLVLCDVVMPEANGTELVNQLRSRRPDLRALFVSGYGEEALRRHGLLDGSWPLVRKPLSPEVLAETLQTLLHTKATV